ncbi:hypothetical protein [Intrasporangium sp.]|uniref:hypothetical protein n=1 Tax=Intrasporangium sp. TaxID=1925024 RepID=UPI0032217184
MSDDETAVTGSRAPVTGDDDIDTALAALGRVEDEPLARHVELGEAVHRLLQGRLGGLGGA